MRRKKAQISSTLVYLIAILIALAVLLSVTGVFGKVFKSISDKSGCEIEFLVSSLTRQGGAQIIEPNCEPHKLTITLSNLTKKENSIKNGLKDYIEKRPENSIAQEYFTHFSTGDGPKEWAMDEIIAKEMKYCWDITGKGKMELFDQWWALLGCEKNGKPCVKNDFDDLSVNDFIEGGKNLLSITWPPNWEVNKPPTFCVLCSRIKFADDVKSFGKVDSMGSWLANNPVGKVGTGSKIPYAAYLQNDAFKGIWANKHSYSYNTNEAHAVVYARINIYKATEWINYAKQFFIDVHDDEKLPEAVNVIKFVPYKDIKDECTYLVG